MRTVLYYLSIAGIGLILLGLRRNQPQYVQAAVPHPAGLGIDVDFYTGPVPETVWLRMKRAGIKFVIAQAWGGRSRNEFAPAQLAAARSVGRMKEAAYILLNYDDKVCPTYSKPVRDDNGSCLGDLIRQSEAGARWQIHEGLAALGSEISRVAFVAIDVEWFVKTAPSLDDAAQASRRQHILDAIEEVRSARKRPVIYTRNVRRHWSDITGCDLNSSIPDCRTLYQVINDPLRPVPLWDVQNGSPDLDHFQPYGEWTRRAGRQYLLDGNLFGLPSRRTVDLNVFDASLFSLD